MTPNNPNYHNYTYIAIVTLGFLICATSIYISMSKIDAYEHNTNRVHRLITASEIELATLESEISDIEKTVLEIKESINNKQKKNKNKKISNEFHSFKLNINNLQSDIAEKQKLLISLNLLKTHTLSQIKTLFWINSALLVIGSLMVILGTAALGFRLEIFQERRNKNRADES